MATAFNLTAQINLQGPSNIKPIVSKIQRDLSSNKFKLNLDVGNTAGKNITSITTRLNSLSRAATKANSSVATLGQTVANLGSALSSLNTSSVSNAATLAKTSKAASSAGKALADTSTQIEEFGKQSGLAIKRFAAFSTVTSIVFGLTNAFSGAFKEFLSFNKEIVRLSQVTGQSVGQLGAVSKEITRLSTSLGVASSDLLTVATTLAQAGLSAEDTKIALEALAKSALAPSFDSLTDTTEGAIAAIRQFGLQAKELDGALGSINAVAAAFAVEAGDIITAIQRTGGVFSAASRGVSEGTDALNEFIAIFTSVRATTRESAETIATGLRTIFTRIQRTQTIEQLREFGIELQDSEKKFVGVYEAARRLSEGLSRIDPRSAQFATISEELGGFRQIGKVIPLIQQFGTAEKALIVAQKGVGSTAKDALTAQQSLAVQFTKTRESFLALVRELGESATFKSFVTVSLLLADTFINLARALKPLLPLLATFAAIKVGGAVTEYVSGFGKAFGRGGGGNTGGGTATPSPTGGSGPSGGVTGAVLSANTNALTSLAQTLNILNQSVLALNQNIVNNNSLLINRPAGRFASGGLVPGTGNRDTYPAMLTPGEFVIRKKAVETIGASNLAQMNMGGYVQKYEGGSPGGVRMPKGRGKTGARGARSKFKELDDTELAQLTTSQLISYAKKQAYNIFTTGGSGMAIGSEFIEVPSSRIIPELESDLVTHMGKRGFWREKIAPFGTPAKQLTKNSSIGTRASALAAQMSKQTDEVAARDQNWTAIRGGSAIDNYLLSSLQEPILADYKTVRGGGSLAKTFHNTRLRQAVNKALDSYDDFDYSPINIDKLVSGMAAKRFANGGMIRKYAGAGIVTPLTTEEKILQNMLNSSGDKKRYQFGLVSLKSGNQKGTRKESFPIGNKAFDVFIGTLSDVTSKTFSKNIEKNINTSLQNSIMNTANTIGKQLNVPIVNQATQKQVLQGSTLASAIGSIFEASLGLLGAPYIDKAESIKSIDFPFGIGSLGEKFNIPSNIPTDATRTVGGSGKNLSDFKGQIQRFLKAINKGSFTKAENKAALKAQNRAMRKSSTGQLLDSVMAAWQGQGVAQKLSDVNQTFGYLKTSVGAPRAFLSNKGTFQNFINSGKLEESTKINLLSAVADALGVSNVSAVTRRAGGGSISGKDTVPALLTPGEFVINKNSAQRIGYGNLNRLNKADKVQGFNKGGVVGYRRGGIVENIGGNAGAIAAVVSVLIPQIERMASSFKNLNGSIGTFGATIGEAAQQASSLVLSAGIAGQAVGASKKTIRNTQVGVGIGGAIGGGLSALGAKSLEKALLKNTDALGLFDKNLQDLTNATSEQLRMEAAERLQKTFSSLDTAIQTSIKNIMMFENFEILGQEVTNLTTNLATTVTAVSAFSNIARDAARTVRRSQMAGYAGPAVGATTKVLGSFAKAIPFLGTALAAVEIGASLWSFFNTNLQKSGEQLTRFYQNLTQITKNAKDFSITNRNFTDVLLPTFNKLNLDRSLTTEEVNQSLGSTKNIMGGVNELNLEFRKLLQERLGAQALGIGVEETSAQARAKLSPESQKVFDATVEAARREFIKAQFIQMKMGQGSDRESAEKAFAKATDAEIFATIEYVGVKNKEIFIAKQALVINSQLKSSFVTLDNVLIRFATNLNRSAQTAINSFDDLDRKIALLTGEPQPVGGEFLRRQIDVLDNLKGASAIDIQNITQTVGGLLNIAPNTKSAEQLQEMQAQIESGRLIQQELPLILRDIRDNPSLRTTTGGLDQIIKDRFKGPLTKAIGGPNAEELSAQIIGQITQQLSSLTDNPDKNIAEILDQLTSEGSAFSTMLKSSEKAQEAFKTVIEASAKVQDKLAEQTKKYIELNQRLIESQTNRLQNEAQEAIELKRAMGLNVTLGELNDVFDLSIRRLTDFSDLPQPKIDTQLLPQNLRDSLTRPLLSGTSDVATIRAELQARQNNVTELEKASKNTALDQANKTKLNIALTNEITIVKRLNEALAKIASSSDKTKNALDKIAEAQNQFRNRRQILADLIVKSSTPEGALELQNILESIEAATRGSFRNISERNLFLQQVVPTLESFEIDPQLFNKLFRTGITDGLESILDPQSLNEINAFLEAGMRGISTQELMVEKYIPSILQGTAKSLLGALFPDKNPRSALANAQAQRAAAGQDIEQRLAQSMDVTTTESINILDKFNQELGRLLPDIIAKLTSLTNLNQKIAQPTSRLSTTGQLDYTKFLDRILGPFQESGMFASAGRYGPLGKALGQEKVSSISKNLGASRDLLEQKRILEQTASDITKLGSIVGGGRGSDPKGQALTAIKAAIKQIDSILEQRKEAIVPDFLPKKRFSATPSFKIPSWLLPQNLAPQPNNNPTQTAPPSQPAPPLNTSSQLDTRAFETGVATFSTSAKLLSEPMNNLSTNLISFSNTANTLSSSLDRFMNEFNKELQASINHTYNGSVGITFNDTLSVSTPDTTNKDNKMILAIVDKLKPYIKEEMNKIKLA